jgi:parvulin-like peptidyl-prolyl isomerase
MKPPKLRLIAPSLFVLAAGASAEIIERVVVKVNSDILTLSEFVNRQAAAVQAARVPPEGIERFLRENNARILNEAIDELLLVQRAEELGLRLRPEYVQDVVENIKKENSIESDEALREQLAREGMTLDDLKRNIQRSILRRQVLSSELEQKTGVSEAEARADYEARKQEYTQPATVRLEEILVKSQEGRDALAEARALVARARAGESFAALAREHSDAPTQGASGDLGTLRRGELNPEIEAELAALAPGDVSEPLATSEGYRIFRVVEKTEGSVVPFEAVRQEIERRLVQERYEKEYDAYVEGLRKTATIDVRVREVPLQVAPQAPGAGTIRGDTLPEEVPEPAPAPAAGETAAEEPEFETTPQARPEKVVPPAVPAAPDPRPTPAPTPSPTPPPGRP